MRIVMLVLAFAYAALAMFTAAVGSFADGGDVWSRLVLVLLHPLAAGAFLLLVFRPTASRLLVMAIAALLLATVAADLSLAAAIAGGAMKGDWELPCDLRRHPRPWRALCPGTSRYVDPLKSELAPALTRVRQDRAQQKNRHGRGQQCHPNARGKRVLRPFGLRSRRPGPWRPPFAQRIQVGLRVP